MRGLPALSSLLRVSPRWLNACVLAAALSTGLGACTTTGLRFDSCAVARLEPGVSTYADAVAELGSLPTNTYIQGDGAFMAHWYVRDSIVTDALYHSQDTKLLFGADGRFLRTLDGRKVFHCGRRAEPVEH